MTVLICLILFVHWLADFVFQSHWMASNKSKNMDALMSHIGVYTLILGGLIIIPIGFYFNGILGISGSIIMPLTLLFIGINSFTHLITDFFTSKITAFYFERKDWHNFFVFVGLDQLIHTLILIISFVTVFNL